MKVPEIISDIQASARVMLLQLFSLQNLSPNKNMAILGNTSRYLQKENEKTFVSKNPTSRFDKKKTFETLIGIVIENPRD